jgi:Nucleotidyltransferase of unknown function (DUF6036)
MVLQTRLPVESAALAAAGERFFNAQPHTRLPVADVVRNGWVASFALMHEDYQHEAIPIDFGLQHLHNYVLSPVGLAVSKIARSAGNDLKDIQSLVRQGLTNSHAIEQCAHAAIGGYVGHMNMLKLNLRDVLVATKRIEVANL